jgi:hypothetical protein
MHTLHERVPDAARYYRVTEGSFRALCPEASGHMNMGFWPAPGIREAQRALLRFALDRAAGWCSASSLTPRGILDLGSGWGGSRAVFDEVFPNTPYVGVNVSAEQVAAARRATAHVPRTEYIVGRVEDREALPWGRVDLLFSIEAAFHFADKASLLRDAAARGIKLATLFEICVEEPSVAADPLLAPSLQNAWSLRRYEQAFAEAGFGSVSTVDVSAEVFPGFLEYLETLDERSYRGRRAVLDQLRRATRLIVSAAARREIRYLLLQAATG